MPRTEIHIYATPQIERVKREVPFEILLVAQICYAVFDKFFEIVNQLGDPNDACFFQLYEYPLGFNYRTEFAELISIDCPGLMSSRRVIRHFPKTGYLCASIGTNVSFDLPSEELINDMVKSEIYTQLDRKYAPLFETYPDQSWVNPQMAMDSIMLERKV